MTTGDHTTFKDEVGAYLLGALSDAERASFEAHLEGCPECRHELERLRPAADLLPRSVEQVEPPPSLKRSLMEVVEREAAPQRERRPLGERLRGLFGGSLRPAFTAAAVLLAVVVGFAANQVLSDDDQRTVVASVKQNVLPDASGRLELQGDGEQGGILEVSGMPSLPGGRVYQAWVERDGMIEPQPTFEVGADGGGAGAVPDDLSDAQAVHLTREPRGGSRAPSEDPILTVKL
jgi:Anti-sigma-K factor rskA/Putative zinc-finger